MPIPLPGKLPKRFLRSCRSCQCHHFPIHQRTLSSRSTAQRHIQEWETLAWSLQALAQKLGLDYHCAVSAAAHPTFISITESTDCKLPQQIITGHSKTLKTKLASTKDRRMLCKFGDFFVEWWYCLDFFLMYFLRKHMFMKFINLLFSRYFVESFTSNAGKCLDNSLTRTHSAGWESSRERQRATGLH